VLLGYPTAFEGVTWHVPEPTELGANGAFNAFRIPAQDTAGFEAFLDRVADLVLDDRRADELLPAGAEAAITPHGTRHEAMRVELRLGPGAADAREPVSEARRAGAPGSQQRPVDVPEDDRHAGQLDAVIRGVGAEGKRMSTAGGQKPISVGDITLMQLAQRTVWSASRWRPSSTSWLPIDQDDRPLAELSATTDDEATFVHHVLRHLRIAGLVDQQAGRRGWLGAYQPGGADRRLAGRRVLQGPLLGIVRGGRLDRGRACCAPTP
jgi:hypothetical protein